MTYNLWSKLWVNMTYPCQLWTLEIVILKKIFIKAGWTNAAVVYDNIVFNRLTKIQKLCHSTAGHAFTFLYCFNCKCKFTHHATYYTRTSVHAITQTCTNDLYYTKLSQTSDKNLNFPSRFSSSCLLQVWWL